MAALCLFFTWLNMTVMLRRLPPYGNYIEMLGKVASSFAFFFLTFACLIVGFAVSLAVLIPTSPIFKDEPIFNILGKVSHNYILTSRHQFGHFLISCLNRKYLLCMLKIEFLESSKATETRKWTKLRYFSCVQPCTCKMQVYKNVIIT